MSSNPILAGIPRIVFLYGLFSFLWMLYSDRLAELIFSNPGHIFLSTFKGLVFIAVTSVLLCRLLLHYAARAAEPERERQSAIEFLQLINESNTKEEMIRAAVDFFKRQSDCEAVGIRLKSGDDYPYYETSGFPRQFVLMENSLCARNAEDRTLLDSSFNPILECMCGNVICGRFDPSKPFFTERGSFWTNHTTLLLATTSEADRLVRTRNRCNGEGYESVALIPLTVGGERLGLLQLNDRRKGRFSPRDIAFFESLAGYLAVALSKFNADELLQCNEELYRSLFNNMLNGFAYCRMLFENDRPHDFVYLAVNDAFSSLTGLKDVVGKKVSEVIPGLRKSDPQIFEIYGRVARSGRPERFEIYIEALRMWFSVSVYSPGEEHFVAVFDVITEHKRAEIELLENKEKISLILNSTDEGIYGLDLLGNCTFCNPSGLKMLGYEYEIELIGRNMHELVHHTKADGTPALIHECSTKEALLKGERVHKDKELLWRADGKSFPAEYWTHPIFKDNELIGSVVTFVDITERVALETQLMQAQKMEAVGHLAGGIAHDFNNILTAIMGYGHLLLLKLKDDPAMKRNLDQILDAANRAAKLTSGLLSFSRKQAINPQPVNLNKTIRNFEGLLCRVIGEDIEVKTMLSEEDVIAVADPVQIEQVLMNLATNARDAMPDGGRVTIITGVTDLESNNGDAKHRRFALISVVDTGVGMNPEIKEKIFNPFFTTKEPGKGTGLGLAIVYGIIKQHNGHITVESENSGTIFNIYLPLDESNAAPDIPIVEKLPANGGNETLLVAEDDKELRMLSESLLTSNGYKVFLAEDGEEAVKKFADNHESIQLVILDMIMPKKNGKEAYEEIRKIRPDVKVLFATGYDADKLEKNSKEEFSIIEKPWSPANLLVRLRQILDN